jgi:hypothetical protein
MYFSHNDQAVSVSLVEQVGFEVTRAEIVDQDDEDTRSSGSSAKTDARSEPNTSFVGINDMFGITDLEHTQAMLRRANADFVVDKTRSGEAFLSIKTFGGSFLMIFRPDGSLSHVEVEGRQPTG